MPRRAAKKDEQPVTWLQTVDGEIYGLTDYWVEDGRLHYVTNYGARNALPFERIDFDKTVQLNARQGVEFVLCRSPRRKSRISIQKTQWSPSFELVESPDGKS